jgi:AraC-like DNA-binding protein
LRSIFMLVGFADQSQFTHSFKKRTGLPPGKYRRAQA